MITLIKQGVIKVLVGLSIIFMALACKIDANYMKETCNLLKIETQDKTEDK